MKVLAVTGATGGHIFPMLGLLDALKGKDKDIDILAVFPRKSIGKVPDTLAYNINYISITAIKPGLRLRNLNSVLNFFKGIRESIVMLLRFRPDVVVGFGSLVSVPMVLFAGLMGVKTLIHEQNVIPGRANRFLAKFADRIAVSFPQTRDYLKGCKKKVALTGNPIRKELRRVDKDEALGFFGFSVNKFTVLVTGGSQGSRRINFAFLAALSSMQDKLNLQVIHLAGTGDLDLLRKKYEDLNINFRLFDFLEPMQYAYSVSDLVVSRAGAGTVAEIMFFGLPAILIPYPFAYRHQAANAEALMRPGCGVIVKDEELDSGILNKNLHFLINNPEKIESMRSSYGNISRLNANELMVESVLSLS